MTTAPPYAGVRYRSAAGRGVLAAAVLGSGVAFLDGTVVNVALPHIATSLHAGFADLQWVLDAYLLTLGALVLVGGALGDVRGRRRVFLVGLVGFGVASAGCAAAPEPASLVAARAVQGVFGALLVPGSLALVTAAFDPADRGRAIGAWSGLSGVTTAAGPFLGGWLVDALSWRAVFVLNLPLVAVAVAVTRRYVPESAEPGRHALDLPGALSAAAGLTLVVAPLIERQRLPAAAVGALLAAGVAALGAFVAVERRRAAPMLPPVLFRSRAFTVVQLVTFLVYGALGCALFLLSVQLQTTLGYSALEAGAATVPLTLLLLLLSARVGALADRIGPRPLLAVGPVLAGGGLALLSTVQRGSSYPGTVLPGVVLFGLGMSLVVAPITTAAMGSVSQTRSGLASGVNNAVARIAQLLAVAVLPALAGIGADVHGPAFSHGYQLAVRAAAVMCAGGGLLAAAALPRQIVAADT